MERESYPLLAQGNMATVTDCRSKKQIVEGMIVHASVAKGQINIFLDTGYYVHIWERKEPEEKIEEPIKAETEEQKK